MSDETPERDEEATVKNWSDEELAETLQQIEATMIRIGDRLGAEAVDDFVDGNALREAARRLRQRERVEAEDGTMEHADPEPSGREACPHCDHPKREHGYDGCSRNCLCEKDWLGDLPGGVEMATYMESAPDPDDSGPEQ